MEVLNTIFLGIIAICMLVITIGMIVVSFTLFGILKTLREILMEIKLDYKVLSPKVHKVIENIESTTSIFSLLSIFRRKKKRG